MIALDGATIEAAMAPQPWPQLNTLHALLGGLAVLSNRALALPAINCTATVGSGSAFLNPGMLPNRCFWHVHSAHGVSCVFRLGGCGEAMDIVSPTVLQAALTRAPPRAVPTITVDVDAASRELDPARGREQLRSAISQLLRKHADTEVVLVRVTPPVTPDRPVGRVRPSAAGLHLTKLHGRYARAVDAFVGTCRELVDRSKRHHRECTNVC